MFICDEEIIDIRFPKTVLLWRSFRPSYIYLGGGARRVEVDCCLHYTLSTPTTNVVPPRQQGTVFIHLEHSSYSKCAVSLYVITLQPV